MNKDCGKTLIIISGVSGAGKTTYTNSLDCPHIHFDEIYSYQRGTLQKGKIKEKIIAYPNSSLYVMDAFIFYRDKFLDLKNFLSDVIQNISVYFMYCSSEEIHKARQKKNRQQKGYVIEKDEGKAKKSYIRSMCSTADNLQNLLFLGDIEELKFVFRSNEHGVYKYFVDDIHFREMIRNENK